MTICALSVFPVLETEKWEKWESGHGSAAFPTSPVLVAESDPRTGFMNRENGGRSPGSRNREVGEVGRRAKNP
jgi:hypothetical protein